MSGDGGDDGDDGEAKQEYIKKEFVARPYECKTGVLEEVQNSIIVDSRPKMQMRISRRRQDFGQDGFNFIDKDANEFNIDLKPQIKGIMYLNSKKVLDIGL